MNNMNFVNINNDKYVVIDKIQTHSVSSQQELMEIKNKFNYDIVLQKENFYFFCNKIEEAQIVEEYK